MDTITQITDAMTGCKDRTEVIFQARSVNEALARIVVSAFAAPLNPTMEEIADVKTAVSEAVTNAIIHAYPEGDGIIHMRLTRWENTMEVVIEDEGIGIPDVERAMEPLYTTRPEMERSGMGFSFMEAFMDELSVNSIFGRGTSVVMTKYFGRIHTYDEE